MSSWFYIFKVVLVVCCVGFYSTVTWAQATPVFEVTNTTVNESDEVAELQITLQDGGDDAINVTVLTQDQSAKASSDYEGAFQTLVFSSKQREHTVLVPIVDDLHVEGTEDFLLVILESTTNSVSQHIIEIIDDDDKRPSISIDDAKVSESVSQVAVALRLDPPAAETVTVLVRSDGTTATAGKDFLDVWQVISFAPGETEKDITLAIINDTVAEEDEVFKVLLTDPTQASIARAVGTVVIEDDGDGQTPRLMVADTSVFEGAGQALVTLQLSPASTVPVRVQLRTVADSAADQEDYRDVYQSISFTPGESTKHVTIPLVDDESDEPDESFLVELSDVSGADLAQDTARITVVDDDGSESGVTFSVVVESINESQGQLPIEIKLSEPPTAKMSVRISTISDTANDGQDFVGLSRVIDFDEGEASKQIDVELLDDEDPESVEALTIALSDAVGAVISVSMMQVKVYDDDVADTLSLEIDDVTVSEDAQVAELVVRLSEESDQIVTVNVQTEAESALVPMDYQELYATLVFSPGEVEKTVSITLIDDNQVEGTEQLSVMLTDAQGAEIDRAKAILVIEDNDEY